MTTLSQPLPFPSSAEIRARNPIYNENRLKLGIFSTNWAGGTARTLWPGALVPTWENSLEISRYADRLGFEAIVSVSRWKSLNPNDPHNPSGVTMEPIVWAAAMAAVTEQAAVFATAHVSAFTPVLFAKQAATIDQIAGGRFGINIVAGWNGSEPLMFGVEMLGHDDRYAQAAEWVDIVKRLWTAEAEFDYPGRFYKLKGVWTKPPPAQLPGPVLMNAGGSAIGRDFCATHCDVALITLPSERLEDAPAHVELYRSAAREKGREIAVWTPVYIVTGATDDEALERRDWINSVGDYECAKTIMDGISGAWELPEPVQRSLARRIVEGGGGFPIVGAADTVVAHLDALSRADIDGVVISWLDYTAGLDHFSREVMPRLEASGLRAPRPVAVTA